MAFLLPPPDEDPIIMLHDYYFQASDLMFKNMKNLRVKSKIGNGLSQNKRVELQSFFQLWLATLRVTVEGFEHKKITKFFEEFEKTELKNQTSQDIELSTSWNSVHSKIKERNSELRLYRNITLHFQENMSRVLEKRKDFLYYEADVDSIEWAYELHYLVKIFFSNYRPIASAIYTMNQYSITRVNHT